MNNHRELIDLHYTQTRFQFPNHTSRVIRKLGKFDFQT